MNMKAGLSRENNQNDAQRGEDKASNVAEFAARDSDPILHGLRCGNRQEQVEALDNKKTNDVTAIEVRTHARNVSSFAAWSPELSIVIVSHPKHEFQQAC
jgi:hypothetical protein